VPLAISASGAPAAHDIYQPLRAHEAAHVGHRHALGSGEVESAAVHSEIAPVPESSEAEGASGLSAEEERVVAELTRTDREVRAHEQAHLAAAGGLARGVSFNYATGPDGKQYAVGGEVSIDTSPGSTPEETIQKAQQIRAAANAPANPSGQDRQVASAAAALEAAARGELAQSERQEREQQQTEGQAKAFASVGESSDIGNLLNVIA